MRDLCIPAETAADAVAKGVRVDVWPLVGRHLQLHAQ